MQGNKNFYSILELSTLTRINYNKTRMLLLESDIQPVATRDNRKFYSEDALEYLSKLANVSKPVKDRCLVTYNTSGDTAKGLYNQLDDVFIYDGAKDDFIKYVKDMLKDYKRVVIATNPSLKGFVEDIKSKAFTRKRVSVVIENVNN